MTTNEHERRGTTYGYARVSTMDQDAVSQRHALIAAGVDPEQIVVDHASGTRSSRPALDDLLARLEPGDVLTVWKLDRLGRSVSHLVTLVDDLAKRGIEFRSISEGLDTTTPTGRLLFHIVAAMAQFERDLIVERTAAGLAAAREKGTVLGRPSKVTPEQYRLIRSMAKSEVSHRTIAATTGVARATVGRIARGEVPSLLKYEQPPEDELPVTETEGA